MDMKKYAPVQVELVFLYEADVLTISAPDHDSAADKDVGGDDMFKD